MKNLPGMKKRKNTGKRGKVMDNRRSNYEKVYARFQDWFVKYPQEDIIRKTGGEFDEKNLYLSFFGERCRISRGTGEITGEGEREIPVTETDHYAPSAVLQNFCRRRQQNGTLPGNPGSGGV